MPDGARHPAPQRVVFRADASPLIGGGHIMRCMALAAEFANRGIEVCFVTHRDTHLTVPALAATGCTIIDIDAAGSLPDVLETAGISAPDLLIIDHYGVGVDETSACRAVVDRIVVVEDLANSPRDCDLLLNQNLFSDDDPYEGMVPHHAEKLLGPRFALLRPDFAALRAPSLADRQTAKLHRIFVSFGLTDVGGWALAIAELLAGSEYHVDIAVGSTAGSVRHLADLAEQHPNITLHVDAPDIADIMSAADLAIGAGGSTSWERCCLGLPSIIGIVAENQRAIAEALTAAGAAITITLEDRHRLLQVLTQLKQQPSLLHALQERSAQICDGLGADRVADAVVRLPRIDWSGALTLRVAGPTDRVDFWLTRNAPRTRAFSGQSSVIDWPGHAAWWSGAVTSDHRLLLTAQLGGRSIGYVRFDRDNALDAYVASIALAPYASGKGLGSRVLAAGLDCLADRQPDAEVVARIHRNNIVSINLFKRCGLSQIGAEDEFLVLRRSLGRGQAERFGDDAWK